MIEVEKKFTLSRENLEKLIAGADFVHEKTIHDQYFDNSKYELGLKDHWLRNRDGRWELKIPVEGQYQEIEDELEIIKYLKWDTSKGLEDLLAEHGYGIFVDVKTKRKEYKKAGFTIDIDSADFGYEIAEIELMVGSPDEVAGAMQRILDFAASLGIVQGVVRGKLSEYLKRFSPEHHQILLKAGVLSV